MDRDPTGEKPDRQRRVRHYSPTRLIRKPVPLPGGGLLSARAHKGRLMVCVKEPVANSHHPTSCSAGQ